MLIEEIKRIYPEEIPYFRKLRDENEMYHFTRWGDDRGTYFYYGTKINEKDYKNIKRVFLDEIEILLKKKINQEIITRPDFNSICKKT
ncbi:MAG: hypothetical protein WCH21_12415, partial [Bacteroidota bacterium]